MIIWYATHLHVFRLGNCNSFETFNWIKVCNMQFIVQTKLSFDIISVSEFDYCQNGVPRHVTRNRNSQTIHTALNCVCYSP